MPLRDHFHPPLSSRFPPGSLHSFWVSALGRMLNRSLPRRYYALLNTHFGSQVAADVAELERLDEPPLVMPAVFPEELEVRVLDELDGARLVAVIELVSPGNKDRAEARRTFAGKCAAYLQRGIGLITIDIVTNRNANLHNELVQLLDLNGPFLMPQEALLYAVAYRPIRRQETDQIDVWPVVLTVGSPLPTLPLALRGARPVPVDLEATYTEACLDSRL